MPGRQIFNKQAKKTKILMRFQIVVKRFFNKVKNEVKFKICFKVETNISYLS